MTLDLLAGKTAALDVNMQPAGATNVKMTYASSDEGIVTVDETGKLAPVAEGEAEVTTTVTGDGLDGPVEKVLHTKVLVKLLPQGITLESTEGLLYVGNTHRLQPHTVPVEAPASTYRYQSSDEAVATVDENGNIRALQAGACEITVTSAEGHTALYSLTVTAAPRQNGGTGNTGGAGGTGGTGNTTPAGGGGSGAGGAAPAPTPEPAPAPAPVPEPAPAPEPSAPGGSRPSSAPPNPNGDGSPGNPIDGGYGESPGDGQQGDGLGDGSGPW